MCSTFGLKRVLMCLIQVCRYLKQLIAGDIFLRYILELDKSGYIAPRFIRKDLEYGEMIQAIRNHRNRWQQVELGSPKSIEVPDAMNSFLHDSYYVDGVYVLHFGAMNTDGDTTYSLHFHQLPSFNKGIGYRHWVHDGLGFSASSIAIQPEIDLMVLLEYHPPGEPTLVDWHQDQSYQIHLRTMSTNKPHPLATSPSMLLNVGKLLGHHFDDWSPITLYGRTLALRFAPGSYGNYKPCIVFFDWIAGVEVGRVLLERHAGCSISFLSEEYFVIPHGYKQRAQSTGQNDQVGRLLIFYISPCTESQGRQIKHVTTLTFPRLCEHQDELRLRLCGGASPLPNATFWSTHTKSVPKIYDLNQWNHLCLHYEAFDRGKAPQAGSQPQWCFETKLSASGLLYISSRVLLALLNKHTEIRSLNEPMVIPWDTWGSHAACLPIMDLPGAYMQGRKSAFIHYGANDESHPQLVVLDFIPKGESERRLIEDEKAVVIPPRELSHAYNQKCSTTARLAVGKFIEPEVTSLDMRYRRTIINLDSEKHQNLCAYGLEIDDEHLVTAVEPPRNVTGRQFFSVYTI